MRSTIVVLTTLTFLAGCSGVRGGNAPGPDVAIPDAPARAAATATIVVHANKSGPAVSSDDFGANLGTWYNLRQSWINPSMKAAGIHLFRFPGGSESDAYHWENGGSVCANQGYIAPGMTFTNFINDVDEPLGNDVSITLNYGSNRTCNGGGDPAEAGAWVAYSKKHGHRVEYWTVGNEVYGSWEYDLHSKPHDPATYSAAVATGYYPAVKAADSGAKLGVVVDTPDDAAWNTVVLKQAQPFDFVELHYYPEYTSSGTNSNDNDQFLLGKALDTFATDLQGLRAQMTQAGVPASTPIYLGEYNADAGAEGTQSVSITNGLFLGQMIGDAVDAGIPRTTFWIAYGACDENGDFSKSLYGWQRTFGTETLFSDNLPESGCYNAPKIPGGTPFPTARVLSLFSNSVPGGSIVRPAAVPASISGKVRAYGFSVGSGYTVLLFNNTLSPVSVNVRLAGATRSSFSGATTIYGKAQYDLSQNNRWVGPVSATLGATGTTVPLTLGPYSVTVLALK